MLVVAAESLAGSTPGRKVAAAGAARLPAALAFSEAKGIGLIDVDGKTRILVKGEHLSEPAWSPGGSLVAFDSPDGISVANQHGVSHVAGRLVGLTGALWSSAGTRLAAVRVSPSRTTARLFVFSPAGGALRLLSTSIQPDIVGDCVYAWSPDSRQIVFESAAGVSAVDARNGRTRFVVPGARAPAWSADGRLLAYVRGGYLMTRSSQGVERRLVRASAIDTPAWSPDGARLAFERQRGDHFDLYVVNAGGTSPHRIGKGLMSDAVWSPDGQRLSYLSEIDGRMIFLDPTTGRQITSSTNFLDDAGQWSADSSLVATSFSCSGMGCPDAPVSGIVVIDGRTGKARQLTKQGTEPSWQPHR